MQIGKKVNGALLCLGLLLSAAVQAQSYVYLTNNTEQTLELNIQQSGASLVKGEHWKQHATQVPPLATVKFLEMNRDTGIKWGKSYEFNTQITAQNGTVTSIKQKLTGTWNFSRMWHGIEDSHWFDDRELYTWESAFFAPSTTIATRAQSARVSGDDIYYVIHPKQESPVLGNKNQLNILAYNVWALLPGLVSKKVSERLTLLSEKLDGYDAIVFSELFDNQRRNAFLSAIQQQYPYQTQVVDKAGATEDGGVLIVSRWPIEKEAQTVYQQCDGSDCIAAKGAKYARINKSGQIYHLFGTHTQAWSSAKNQATRTQQFIQLKGFIDAQNLPADAPVLIAGDLNVDKGNSETEYFDMLNLLQAQEVVPEGAYLYTSDGRVNAWTSGKAEILDYILYSTAHRAPVTATSKVLSPRSIDSKVFTEYDLSDHFAIQAQLGF